MYGNANYDSLEYKNFVLKKKQLQSETAAKTVIEKPQLANSSQALSSSSGKQTPVSLPCTVLPRNTLPKPAKRSKPKRPSLSEQLANIGAQADSITQSIRKDRDYLQPRNGSSQKEIQSMPAKCFSIGTLNCRYPSPVFFYNERCEYQFNHPYESSVVTMTIYYRDMSDVNIVGTKIRFKLPKRMALFIKDFDPSNPQHLIVIELSSTLHTNNFRDKILPLIRR